MSPRGGRGVRTARAALALGAGALLVLPTAPAAAAPDAPPSAETYSGTPHYPDLALPPTGQEPQSKLWFHDQRWWGLLSVEGTTSTVRVHELMPDHTWRPTEAVTSTDATETGDAYEDGDGAVHVVTRHNDRGLYYSKLTFDAATDEYTATPPALITKRGRVAPATIAKEDAGRLWVAWATPYDVSLAWSDDGRTWTPQLLADAGDGTSQEAAALINYGNRLGVMWSDQATDTFYFASHRSGDPRTARWPKEVALAGPAQADNHISLVRIPGVGGPDSLAAAVKTSVNDVDEDDESALVKVLVRSPEGDWTETNGAAISDGYNDARLQVDATNRTLHLLASSEGRIVHKTTPLDDVRFDPGLGDFFVRNNDDAVLSYPTGSKEPVTDRTGMVMLATDIATDTYRHAELAIPSSESSEPGAPTPGDESPPERPSGLLAEAAAPDKAVLSWNTAQDRDRWAPAATGIPAAGYVVFRDGVELGTVESLNFTDTPRTRDEATEPMSVTYQVAAVDASGNRSRAAEVVVELPAVQRVDVAQLVGIAVLVLALGLGAMALRRLWITQRPPVKVPQPASPDRDRTPAGAAR